MQVNINANLVFKNFKDATNGSLENTLDLKDSNQNSKDKINKISKDDDTNTKKPEITVSQQAIKNDGSSVSQNSKDYLDLLAKLNEIMAKIAEIISKMQNANEQTKQALQSQLQTLNSQAAVIIAQIQEAQNT